MPAGIEEKQNEVVEDERLVQTIGEPNLIFTVLVTLLVIGISLSGMSIVIGQKWLWDVGMVPGVVGSVNVILDNTPMID